MLLPCLPQLGAS